MTYSGILQGIGGVTLLIVGSGLLFAAVGATIVRFLTGAPWLHLFGAFTIGWILDLTHSVMSWMILLGVIVGLFLVVMATIRWIGSGWILLTVPLTMLASVPLLRWASDDGDG